MGASKATTTSSPAACPTEDRIIAFAEGRDIDNRAEIVRHLGECDDCRRLVGVLASSSDRSASPMSSAALAPSAGLLDPGNLIAGKYEIVSTLGRGGMGIVVEALHRTLRQRVALKFLLGPLSR